MTRRKEGGKLTKKVLGLDFANRTFSVKFKGSTKHAHPFDDVVGFQTDVVDPKLLQVFMRHGQNGVKYRYEFFMQTPTERRTVCHLLQRVLDRAWLLNEAADLDETAEGSVAALSRQVLCRGRIMKRSKSGKWKLIYVAVVDGKMLRFCNDSVESKVRTCLSLAGARISIEAEDAFDIITGNRRVILRCDQRAYRDQWLVAFSRAIEAVQNKEANANKGASLGSGGGGSLNAAPGGMLAPSPMGPGEGPPSSTKNSSAPDRPASGAGGHGKGRLGLSAHFFLNFSVTKAVVGSRAQGEARLLHLDVEERTLEVVNKEMVKKVHKVDDIQGTELGEPDESRAGERLLVSVRGGKDYAFDFQSIEELECFLTVLGDLQTGEYKGIIRFPRQIMCKGRVEKRGLSGTFFPRFAVLVPGKIFLMRSKDSYFPLSTLCLNGAEVRYDGDRTIEVEQAAVKLHALRAASPEDAFTWYEAIAKSRARAESAAAQQTEAAEAAEETNVEGAEEAEAEEYEEEEVEEFVVEEEEEEVVYEEEEEEVVYEEEEAEEGGELAAVLQKRASTANAVAEGEGGNDSDLEEGAAGEGEKRTRRGTWTMYDGYTPTHMRVGQKGEITGEESMGFDEIVKKEQAFDFWGVKAGSHNSNQGR